MSTLKPKNDYIFYEEDGQTYRDVYNATSVTQQLYRSRSQSRVTNSSKTNSGSSTRQLFDEIEDEDVEYENVEEEIEFVENKSLDPNSYEEWDYFGEKDVYRQI